MAATVTALAPVTITVFLNKAVGTSASTRVAYVVINNTYAAAQKTGQLIWRRHFTPTRRTP
jgi:hypothetical protein